MLRFLILFFMVFSMTTGFRPAVAEDRPPFCTFAYVCPTAARLTPQVGQRGTQVKLLLEGARLQQIEDVLFYGEGLSWLGARPLREGLHDRDQVAKPVAEGIAAELTFEIDPGCPLGEHFFRVRTHETLSEMLSFFVSPLPCVAEHHKGHDREGNTNGTIASAQTIELGTTVYGFHPEHATIDHDFYALELKQGQRLNIEVWSACLGYEHHRGITDLAITVYGPGGNKIAYADDSSLRDMDPLCNLVIQESGRHYVDLHQNMDFEGSLRHYVAHFTDAPRPLVVFPNGGQAGTTLNAALLGDLAGPIDVSVNLPADPGRFEESLLKYRHRGNVIPNLIRVSDFGNVVEDGGDHFTQESAQRYSGVLPVAFNGRISHEGKTDWFRFAAKKGQRYRVRTYSATLGSSLDAKLQIVADQGTDSRIHLSADDSNWIDHDWWGKDKVWSIKDRMDPITVFEADADGFYLVGVSDSQRLFGSDYVYRVEFQPLSDQAFVYFPTDYRESPNKRDCLVVPRGNTVEHTLAIIAGTGNLYRGGIRIVAEGLPPGVRFECPLLEPGQTLTQATLSADADAPDWTGLIDLRLEATEPDADFTGSFVHNVPATQRRGGYNVVFNRVRRCALAVVQEAPIRLSVKQPVIGLAQNAMIDLEVKVQRQPGFDGDVHVQAAWTPVGVSTAVPLVIPAGETVGHYRLQASSSVKDGVYPITLTGREALGGDRVWGTGYHFVSSPPVDLEIVRPYLEVQFERTAIERQTEGEWVANVKTIQPLPGNALAELVRLPKGIELIEKVVIRPGAVSVRFPVRVTNDALTGQYQEIGCQITIEHNGQTIVQQTGNGILRVDAERN